MKILACIFCLSTILFGASIKDITIQAYENSLEVLLLLDSKFEDKVIRKDEGTFSSVIFKNLNYNKNKVSSKTKLIEHIEIFAKDNDVYVVFDDNDFKMKYDLEVLNSSNAIKILLSAKESVFSNMLSNSPKSLEEAIGTLKAQNNATTPSLESWRYFLVVGVLGALLIALIVIKKKMSKKSNHFEFSYFKKPSISVSQSINLDLKNKIIILDSKDCSYILFVGQSGAFVVDKIPKMKEQDLEKFILENKQNKLSYFLKAYEEKYEGK